MRHVACFCGSADETIDEACDESRERGFDGELRARPALWLWLGSTQITETKHETKKKRSKSQARQPRSLFLPPLFTLFFTAPPVSPVAMSLRFSSSLLPSASSAPSSSSSLLDSLCAQTMARSTASAGSKNSRTCATSFRTAATKQKISPAMAPWNHDSAGRFDQERNEKETRE